MNLYLTFQGLNVAVDVFNQELERLLQNAPESHPQRICIAVSGGSDSLALLFLTHLWANEHRVELCCVTVDHQLREESRQEALFVQETCQKLNISHTILTWEKGNMHLPLSRLENLAREARYSLITEYCHKHDIPILFTAHHWNDQLETYLIRKEFNSDKSGLACMSQVRSLSANLTHIRPLLHFSKSHLAEILRDQGVTWKEDSMNDDESFMRVRYRKQISNCSKEELLALSQTIDVYGQERRIIEKAAVRFLRESCQFSVYGYAVIELSQFLSLPVSMRLEVLKRVLWNIGGKKYAPNLTMDIERSILARQINTIARCLIRVRKNKLCIFRENRNLPTLQVSQEYRAIVWDNRFQITLPDSSDNYVIMSSQPSTLMPKDACAGYPGIYKNSSAESITNATSCDIVFLNKINLFDIFV